MGELLEFFLQNFMAEEDTPVLAEAYGKMLILNGHLRV